MVLFKGSATALITPIKNDEIDFGELSMLIERQIDAGSAAVIVLGTTGEPSTMTEKEKHAVITHVCDNFKGKIKIIIGTGGNNTKTCVALTKFACEAGADGILAVTPYYNKCTDAGMIEYYNALLDASSVPVICYNVPSRTGVSISVAVAKAVSGHKNFAGIKEASGNIQVAMKFFEAGISPIYSGDDCMTLPIMSLGGAGVISVSSNVIPKPMASLVSACLAGEYAKALEIHNEIYSFTCTMFCEVNPMPVKYCMGLVGVSGTDLRSPLCEISDPSKARVNVEFQKIKHLV